MIKTIIKLSIEYISGKNVILTNTKLCLFSPRDDRTLYKSALSTVIINKLADIIKILLKKWKNFYNLFYIYL